MLSRLFPQAFIFFIIHRILNIDQGVAESLAWGSVLGRIGSFQCYRSASNWGILSACIHLPPYTTISSLRPLQTWTHIFPPAIKISPNRLTRGGGAVNGDFDGGGVLYNEGGKPYPVSLPSGDRVSDVFPSPAGTSLGDLLPVDTAVPLGLLERGAERGTTVRLAAARSGLARLSSLRLRDTLTGAVYAPAHPYEVFVEN